MPRILDTSSMPEISNRSKQSIDDAEKQNVVHVERQDDDVSLVLVDVHARIRLEWTEGNDGESSAGDLTSSFLRFTTRGTLASSLIS